MTLGTVLLAALLVAGSTSLDTDGDGSAGRLHRKHQMAGQCHSTRLTMLTHAQHSFASGAERALE